MEQRKFRRVPFHADAIVKAGGVTVSGTIDNLSMKGLFLNAAGGLAGDELLEITILLSGSSSKLSINLKGRTSRQTDKGVAIEFREMDLDSFIHLKNVVSYNSSDADEIVEEYYQSIGPK